MKEIAYLLLCEAIRDVACNKVISDKLSDIEAASSLRVGIAVVDSPIKTAGLPLASGIF